MIIIIVAFARHSSMVPGVTGGVAAEHPPLLLLLFVQIVLPLTSLDGFGHEPVEALKAKAPST